MNGDGPTDSDLSRRLEESEKERAQLLEALHDTLQLQRMAEEAGSTREVSALLESFSTALDRVCPWSAAEIRLREDWGEGRMARAFRSDRDGSAEAEIRELEEEGLLEWSLEAIRPSTLPSLAARSGSGWVAVPLLSRGVAVGLALVRPAQAPSNRQIELLRLVAAQAATALDNLSHLERIRHGYAELRSLHAVAASLGRTLDPQELFEVVRKALDERLSPKVVALLVLGTAGSPDRILSEGAPGEECREILGRVAASESALRLDASLPNGRILSSFGCARALGIPLSATGGRLGAMLVAGDGGGAMESDDAREWLESVSRLLSAAIDNSRLYEEVLSANRRLTEFQTHLVQVGRLQGIGQLAGGIAHEINNPLQVILGRSQILQSRTDLPPTALPDLSRIESETMRIAHIVRGLQDFARQDGGGAPAQPVRLSRIADSVLELLAHRLHRQGIEVAKDGFDSSPRVAGEIDQLRQVVLNLCLNAMQAMPQGGTLRLRASSDGEWARLDVNDSGPGVAPEDLERIFDPFFGRGPGTGLGLAIGFAIAKRHGGLLECVPSTEGGAGFRLSLPMATDSVSPG